MNKYTSALTEKTKYYKWREEGTDNWYCGKTEQPTIPRGSTAITFYQYMLMAYGKEATMKAMREMKKIIGMGGRGAIELATEQDIKHLPSANQLIH